MGSTRILNTKIKLEVVLSIVSCFSTWQMKPWHWFKDSNMAEMVTNDLFILPNFSRLFKQQLFSITCCTFSDHNNYFHVMEMKCQLNRKRNCHPDRDTWEGIKISELIQTRQMSCMIPFASFLSVIPYEWFFNKNINTKICGQY